jgi:predicted RNA binding protein YcfA (HicA-like mRNA interferase family)
MATRSKADIERALLKKGFQLQPKRDHRYYSFQFSKEVIIETKVSHGSKGKDIPSDLISKMAKQCRLSKNLFSIIDFKFVPNVPIVPIVPFFETLWTNRLKSNLYAEAVLKSGS